MEERNWTPDFLRIFLIHANAITNSNYPLTNLRRGDFLDTIRFPFVNDTTNFFILDKVKFDLDFLRTSKFIFKFRYGDISVINVYQGIFNIPSQTWMFTNLTEKYYDEF